MAIILQIANFDFTRILQRNTVKGFETFPPTSRLLASIL